MLVQGAMGSDHPGGHPGVAGNAAPAEAMVLNGAGLLDPCSNFFGGFRRLRAGYIRVLNRRNFDVKIDAIQKRAADALAVLEDLAGIAATDPFEIACVTAMAGMHCHSARQHYIGFVAP